MTLEQIVKRDLAELMWAKQQLEAQLLAEQSARKAIDAQLTAAHARIEELETAARESEKKATKDAMTNGHAAGHP